MIFVCLAIISRVHRKILANVHARKAMQPFGSTIELDRISRVKVKDGS